MAESLAARWWRGRDRPGWKNFGIAMLVLSVALLVSLFSAAAAQTGRIWVAGGATVVALGLAGWVAITIVPALARRTSLRWFVYQVDYRLTREGIIYLGAVFILVLAAVNTGNNLLFMILACTLAGILISGVLSRIVLTGVEFCLLQVMCERAGRVLSREQLLDLTQARAAGSLGRSIDVLISRLRRKIERDLRDPEIIKTVRSGGYLFAVEAA